MIVLINNHPIELLAGATLADAIRIAKAQPPFAAAVNMQFVPHHQYDATVLKADDAIEIIRPVTGG